MKFVFLFMIAALSPSYAQAGQDLTCSSSEGYFLEWFANSGELRVNSPAGELVVDSDGLTLLTAETRYVETYPVKFVTPIVYGDEEPTIVLAEVHVYDNGAKRIVFTGGSLAKVVFLCK